VIRPVDIAVIVVRDRLRPLDQAHVELLAQSMRRQKEAGLPPQIAPIEVGRSGDKYILVTGWHRLEAAKQAGLKTVDARIIDGDADKRRLREIEENVCRHDLNALDKAFFVREWCALQGGLEAPKGKSEKEENLADQCSAKIALPADAAERLKLSRRAIFYHLKLARTLRPVRNQLAGLPIASNQSELLRLARETDEEKRAAIIDKMRSGKAFKEAAAPKKAVALKKGKHGALTAAWNGASVTEQDAFLQDIIKALSAPRRKKLGQWMVDNGIMPRIDA
jgi:ParB family chromosome partitioning protein